ncbi:hypothetical protein AVEN_103388-1 [Araneus ventricosus]|uniref:Uncharacterized protein n=1 Tax=Araneus ventricosus TaxID=182803 RepID=A0A4Y2X2Q1_ARAVE|nr:hypothetical protein AVEN_103388-1 [Araneus ventricosus]
MRSTRKRKPTLPNPGIRKELIAGRCNTDTETQSKTSRMAKRPGKNTPITSGYKFMEDGSPRCITHLCIPLKERLKTAGSQSLKYPQVGKSR